jgi:nucleotide-binding universal stress UspA family protein
MERDVTWARMLAPLSGTAEDEGVLAGARTLAEPFGAEVRAAFAPTDAAEIMPLVGEGLMGGAYLTALDGLKAASAHGETHARRSYAQGRGEADSFVSLGSPVWAALAMEARLSDVVVFGQQSARGRGPLSELFRQVLVEERRPVLVARPGLSAGGTAAVAWDGGKEATRAARAAIPWLKQAERVVILSMTAGVLRPFEPERLGEHFAARGVRAEIRTVSERGDTGPVLLAAARASGANLLVAGAFGHPRLQEFIFGGVTRAFLHAETPALFLSH